MIREASMEDIGELSAMFDEYRLVHGASSNVQLCAEFLGLRLANGESRALLAVHEGRPVGFAHLYPRYASLKLIRNWMLSDLYVKAGARRQGFARQLVEASKRLALEAGADTLLVTTTRDNVAAKALYLSSAFERVEGLESFSVAIR